MPPTLLPGKLPAALLRELLAEGPPLPAEVRLGPRAGEDACAIDIAGGTLVAATDPITLTGNDVGAHAVVVNANDVAVMGARPRWFLAAVLLPEGTGEDAVREIFARMRSALEVLGALLVGGHTEVTTAVSQPVVVGQMLGLVERGRVIPTGGARPGHVVVQAGPAPVEGAAVLAVEARDRLREMPLLALARAEAAIREPGISVVDAALLAAEFGAAAMHDPTEGGLASGLVELAEASGVRIDVDLSRVLWFEPGREVCRALGADPWGTLASGALLAALTAEDGERVCAELEKRGTRAAVIGRVREGAGVWLDSRTELHAPARDEVARVLS